MEYNEKLDVIDLIIEVLRLHEKKLDELISRLDNILSSETNKKILENWK